MFRFTVARNHVCFAQKLKATRTATAWPKKERRTVKLKQYVNYFCLAKEFKVLHILTINLKESIINILVLSSSRSELAKRHHQTGRDDFTNSSLHIHELFGSTHILQVVMNIDYKLESSNDEDVAYFSGWDIFTPFAAFSFKCPFSFALKYRGQKRGNFWPKLSKVTVTQRTVNNFEKFARDYCMEVILPF